MRGPLSLVIDDGNGPRHVTRRTTGLRFKRSAYGGDIDLTAVVSTDRGTFTDLGPGDSVTVYDGRTAAPVFRATANLPGVTVGPQGEAYDLQAFGGAARLQAITDSLCYVHALDEGWRRNDSTKGAKVSEEEKKDGTPVLEVSWAKLFELETDDQGQFVNSTLQRAGLKLARLRCEWDAGRNSAALDVRALAGTSVDTLTSAASDTASTSGGVLLAHVGGGGIGANEDVAALRVKWNGGTLDVEKSGASNKIVGGVPDKSFWVRFWDVRIRQVLKNKYGDDLTGSSHYTGTNGGSVRAHEVIADMLGRGMCPGLDKDKVTVEAFSYDIDALAWLDGIKMGDALNELLLFEPTLTWQVYGDTAHFGAWPSEPRYVVSAQDGGVTHPGEEVSLADRVYVEWTDRRRRQQRTKVTDPDIPVKMEADPISLPEGVGSEANALKAGQVALSLHNDPPRAGTAVVRRPILDRWSGCVVLPHEIMPGCLVLEQETGHEFRLVETDYSDDDQACVLTLGEPRKSLEQVIARLERKQRRRRKK